MLVGVPEGYPWHHASYLQYFSLSTISHRIHRLFSRFIFIGLIVTWFRRTVRFDLSSLKRHDQWVGFDTPLYLCFTYLLSLSSCSPLYNQYFPCCFYMFVKVSTLERASSCLWSPYKRTGRPSMSIWFFGQSDKACEQPRHELVLVLVPG